MTHIYQVLPLWANVDRGVMAIKGILTFLKTQALPLDCLMSYPEHLLGDILPLCKYAASVFYSPSQLG